MSAPETATAARAATDPEAYAFWADEHVRFDDLDALGHVNNKSFTTYAESGRAAFLLDTGIWVQNAPEQNVIARLEVDYLRELHYPADLRIGVRVLRVGTRSFTLGLGIFAHGHCVATAQTVLVRINAQTRASTDLNDNVRSLLERWR